MPIVVPFTFATAGLNTPTSQLDSNFSTIASFVNARVPGVGALASRPAAGNLGATFVTTDELPAYLPYIDDGSAWHAFGQGVLHGQCILLINGVNITLSPYNGNHLVINSAIQIIPDAGVTVAVGTALIEGGTPAANTTYYVYASMSGATMIIQLSATAHATQAGTGIEIRTGDATRTLVGMVRITAAVSLVDTLTQRFVATYFNRRSKALLNNFTANRTTASATYVEVNTEIRIETLIWGGEALGIGVSGVVGIAANSAITAIGIDGTNQENAISQIGAGTVQPIGISFTKGGLGEGYHYVTLLGATSGGSTGTWYGAAYVADTTVRSITSLSGLTRG